MKTTIYVLLASLMLVSAHAEETARWRDAEIKKSCAEKMEKGFEHIQKIHNKNPQDAALKMAHKKAISEKSAFSPMAGYMYCLLGVKK